MILSLIISGDVEIWNMRLYTTVYLKVENNHNNKILKQYFVIENILHSNASVSYVENI